MNPVLRLLPSVLTVFLGCLAVGIPLPALPGHVHDALGFGTVVVGITIGIQSVATLLTRQYAGGLVDTRGPKLAAVLGLSTAAAAGGLYLLSLLPGLGSGTSLAVLLAGRMLLGLGESLFLTSSLSWGITLVGPASAGTVIVLNGIAIYGALAVGAPIGAALQARYGFPAVALAVVVLPLLGLAVASARTAVQPPGGVRQPFRTVIGAVLPPGAGLGLTTVGYATLASFLPLLYTARGWDGAGYALTAFGLCYIGVRFVLGWVPDRYGTAQVAIPCALIEALGQVLVWRADTPAVALLGAAITGAGFSLFFPVFGIETVRRVPPASRGTALGVYAAFFDLALGVTGPVTGLLAQAFGLSAAFLAGALCALACVPLALALRPGVNPAA